MMPAQNDTFWHLRAGADIWATGQVPRVDHYSHTFAGAAWPDHEWLAQAMMFAVYRVGGMPGLELGAAALVLGAAALTWRLMVGPLATRALLMTTGSAARAGGLGAAAAGAVRFLLALLLVLLVRERYRIIPLLFVLWANAHGGVVLGGLVLARRLGGGGAALVACARRRRSPARDAPDARRPAVGPGLRGGAARLRHLPLRHRIDGALDGGRGSTSGSRCCRPASSACCSGPRRSRSSR